MEILLANKQREIESERVKWENIKCEMSSVKAQLEVQCTFILCECVCMYVNKYCLLYLKDKESLLAAKDGQLSEMESALSVAQKKCADARAAILLANKEKQV